MMVKYIVIAFFLIAGCTGINTKATILKEYPYYKQLDIYFNEKTNTKLFKLLREKAIDFLFIIPLDSCSECLTETFEKIIQNKDNRIGVVFLGKPKNAHHKKLQNDIKKINSNVYSKIENEIQLYETNIFGPTFFTIKNNKINYSPLTNQIWQELIIELGWD